MSLIVQSDLPLSETEVKRLWQETIAARQYQGKEDEVAVRVVATAEMQELNRRYRGKDIPTNVLTFSYPAGKMVPVSERVTEHDIVLCVEVGQLEAQARHVPWRDYAALLLVHAFLHATGLDHEASSQDEQLAQSLERSILQQAGFGVDNL